MLFPFGRVFAGFCSQFLLSARLHLSRGQESWVVFTSPASANRYVAGQKYFTSFLLFCWGKELEKLGVVPQVLEVPGDLCEEHGLVILALLATDLTLFLEIKLEVGDCRCCKSV